MWNVILNDLKALLAKIESEAMNVWIFLTSYIQEAFTEEEAALFPLIESQAAQILDDVVKTQGLTVKERVSLAETEIMAALAVDGKVAVATLVSAYVAITAHKMGLTDGNQGVSSAGDFSGNTNIAPVNPAP